MSEDEIELTDLPRYAGGEDLVKIHIPPSPGGVKIPGIEGMCYPTSDELTDLPGHASDGHHTFDELYEHRCMLFIALMSTRPNISWWSRRHHDGSMFDPDKKGGWIITGMTLPDGTVGYHMRDEYIPLLRRIRERPHAPEWDGSSSVETLRRLRDWIGFSDRSEKDEEVPMDDELPDTDPAALCAACGLSRDRHKIVRHLFKPLDCNPMDEFINETYQEKLGRVAYDAWCRASNDPERDDWGTLLQSVRVSWSFVAGAVSLELIKLLAEEDGSG